MTNSTGVSLFIDVYYAPLRLGFECEGFSAHAETITRERFSLEKSKVRSMLRFGISYVPFSKDELDKRPEACRNSLLEILDFCGHKPLLHHLTIYERETLRYLYTLFRPFNLADVRTHLGVSRNLSIKVLKGLLTKQLIRPLNPEAQRYYHYTVVVEEAIHYIR
ncbi:hypothetical protein JCM10914A_42190 [Paenibacillus sp. JCM 10914]|uniref:hypothetical protein n=1 Tax=Paenibacillus sp. JCM 10914 TaxID=1236974 RepID=UPI000562F532|nr:hypothetical protein [Paenibacillus sp. JCM 10914]